MEENPYKAPESDIRDLTLSETPGDLRYILNLLKAAFALSMFQLVINFVFDPEMLLVDGEFSLLYILFMVVIFVVIFFLIYYLCLFRPVLKRKRLAAWWLFIVAVLLSVLSFYFPLQGLNHRL